MTRSMRLTAALAVAALALWALSPAQAGIEGRYRIHLMNNSIVEGDVKENADGSYEVKTRHGAIVTIRKNQVKAIVPLEEAQPAKNGGSAQPSSAAPAAGKGLRREISDAEIEELLAGIKVESYDDTTAEAASNDLLSELPLNFESLQAMLRKLNLPVPESADKLADHPNVLVRPHVVMVYTAPRKQAMELGARLEAVWRWNVRFVEQLKIPPVRPEYKLEVYFFAKHKEFENYSLNEGTSLPGGVLGYYQHDINRSHFFDLWDMPMLQPVKEMLKQKNVPHERRRFLTNYINAWVEFKNLEVIQHEIGHHIHHNIGVFPMHFGQAPTWLVEGTTMMFEVPPPTTGAGGASLGELNDYRLDEIRKFPKWDEQSLRDFVLVNQTWYQGYNYPRGWALVYYLWKERREGLSRYIQTIYNDWTDFEELTLTDRQKLFEDCFGVIDKDWVDKFYAFLEGLQLRKSRLPPDL